MLLTPPPVKLWAIENNIPFIQPDKLSDDLFADSMFDFFLVVAYGKIMPESIVNYPKLGSINIHYSLLPKYRGASPVESAVLNGESSTGITIQKMEFKMDTGPIIASQEVEIGKEEKAPDLRKRLVTIGTELFVEKIPQFLDNKIILKNQDENNATYCKKIKKEDGQVDIEKDNPENIFNKFKAYANWPRIFFFKKNKRVIITDMTLLDGKLLIRKVLPEGKKEVSWNDFLRQN
jgi:methionyl-tRNA formyltransferase